MRAASRFTQLTGATAVALALIAPSARPNNLIDGTYAGTDYGIALSKELARVTGNDDARLAARGFVVTLEEQIKTAPTTPQIADYPKPVSTNMLRITGVAPPAGMEDMPVKICAEKDNKVLTLLDVNQRTGALTPSKWDGPRVSETPTSAACKQFILTYRNELNQLVAQRQQPEQPRIVAATDGRTASNVAQAKPVALGLAQ